MGRKPKINPERIEKICENVRLGMTYEMAAQAAGICAATFYNWQQTAEAEQQRLARPGARRRKYTTLYLEFLESLKKAEADAEQAALQDIHDAGTGGREFTETREKWELVNGELTLVEKYTVVKTLAPQWQARGWFLERRYPKRWARIDRHAVLSEEDSAALFDLEEWKQQAQAQLEGYDDEQ